MTIKINTAQKIRSIFVIKLKLYMSEKNFTIKPNAKSFNLWGEFVKIA